MALQPLDLLMRMSPTAPLDMGPDKSLERQRLALAKQEFEEIKRKNAEDAELHRMAEAGEMTRARMQDERDRAQQEALAQAETLKQRREAHDVMLNHLDAHPGDYEGLERAANRLNELGGLAERTGEDENGLPTWRIALDAQQAKAEDANREATLAPGAVDNPDNPYSTHPGDESLTSSLSRMPAIGYDTLNTREPPGAGPGIASSEDLTPEQIARVTGGGTAQRAAGAPAQAPLTAESSPAALGEAEYGPPTAPDADPNVIKPEYRVPAGLDPLGSIRPRSMAPVPPAPADIMGGVPKDVIDTGAMNAQTQRRLGPVMASIEASMPAAYRGATEANNRAAQLMALPADKTLEASLKLRAPADAALASERAHEFRMEEQTAAAEAKAAAAKAKEGKPLTRAQEQELVQRGNKRAETTFSKRKVQAAIDTFAIADEVDRILTSGDPLGEDRVINLLGQLNAQSKQQSDQDANRLTGLDRATLLAKLDQYSHQLISGGFDDDVKKSMLDFAHSIRERNKETAFDWMHSTLRQARTNPDPLVGRGYREFAESAMSQDLLDAYDKENPPVHADAADGAASATPVSAADGAVDDGDGNDFEDAVDAAADAKNLDPDKWRAVMGPESKGDGNAKNPHSSASGIIQMLDKTARRYVNPRTGKKFADAAEFRALPREEQAPIAADYLHDSGVTADSPPADYALAVAAPAFVGKSANRNAVVYPKGSDEWDANPGWRPKDGGDITVGSLLDFYMPGKKNESAPAAPAKPTASGRKGSGDAALLDGIEDEKPRAKPAATREPAPPVYQPPPAVRERPPAPAPATTAEREPSLRSAVAGATDESVAAAYDLAQGIPHAPPSASEPEREPQLFAPGHVYSREEAARVLERQKGHRLNARAQRLGQ